MQGKVLIRLTVAAVVATCVSSAWAQSAHEDYASLCRGCHGASFSSPAGARATPRSGRELAAIIRGGIAQRGMPAFGAQLSEVRIERLADLIEAQTANSP